VWRDCCYINLDPDFANVKSILHIFGKTKSLLALDTVPTFKDALPAWLWALQSRFGNQDFAVFLFTSF
ncbi:MAG TPA: hypothetical protein PL157_08585, partial [Acidobacteriota bacterium]|nr:hypothetical protein [Acidobacteriota bacterium]